MSDTVTRLAEALAHHSTCGIGFFADGCTCLSARQRDAAALAPVVDAIAREKAAAELGWVLSFDLPPEVTDPVAARAAFLRDGTR